MPNGRHFSKRYRLLLRPAEQKVVVFQQLYWAAMRQVCGWPRARALTGCHEFHLCSNG